MILFKICLANIRPCLESRSNLLSQDVVVVSMLLTGRKFDLAELILKYMMYVFEGNSSTGLPYEILLTRIFDLYGVDLYEVYKYIVNDFLDVKSLA